MAKQKSNGSEFPRKPKGSRQNQVKHGKAFRSLLTESERETVIRYMRSGAGRILGCEFAKVNYERFRVTIRVDHEFARQCLDAEKFKREFCFNTIFGNVMAGSEKSASLWLDHDLKQQQAADGRRLRWAQLALEREKARLEPRLAQEDFSTRGLSQEELDVYNAFWRGEELSDDDLLRYAKIERKVCGVATRPRGAGEGGSPL